MSIKQVLFNHRVAIIFAVLVSVITAFPQVYFRIEHRSDGIYQGIELLPDSPWSPRVREVQDGHPNFGNIYQKDGKDNPYLLQPLGSMVVAYMGEMFGLDINNTLLLSRLVLPFIVFLLIYGFVFLVSKDKLVALSSAVVLLLADSLLSFSGLSLMLHGVSPDHFLRLARPVNPAMIYFSLFSFLASFWLFYRKRDLPWQASWRYGVASAVLLGLNFYNYFYTWTYLYAFGGLLVLILLVRKEWREAFRMWTVFLFGLILAIPYILNLYRASLFPAFEEVSQRVGIILTHEPLFVGASVILALAVFLLFFPREDKEKYIFGLAILLAPFMTMNQQILTGRIMQADHYHWFFHKPLGIIFVFTIIFYLLDRRKLNFYKKALATLIIVLSIATGIFVQTYSYYYDTRDGGNIAIERQKYGPVMEWLSTNVEKEAVVFANNEISNITTIYTPLNVFYHRGVCCTTLSATKPRLLDMLFTFFRLRWIDKESAYEAFSQERNIVSEQIYGIYYRKLYGQYELIPEDKFEEIVELYKETLSTPRSKWLYDIWEKYEVEYLVWDKKNDPDWRLGTYYFLEEAVVFGDIAIYRYENTH